MSSVLILKCARDSIYIMNWCFATVNNKLAEIFFNKKKGKKPEIFAHCYIKETEYTTKKEKQWIANDMKKYRFSYYNKKYTEKLGL